MVAVVAVVLVEGRTCSSASSSRIASALLLEASMSTWSWRACEIHESIDSAFSRLMAQTWPWYPHTASARECGSSAPGGGGAVYLDVFFGGIEGVEDGGEVGVGEVGSRDGFRVGVVTLGGGA